MYGAIIVNYTFWDKSVPDSKKGTRTLIATVMREKGFQSINVNTVTVPNAFGNRFEAVTVDAGAISLAIDKQAEKLIDEMSWGSLAMVDDIIRFGTKKDLSSKQDEASTKVHVAHETYRAGVIDVNVLIDLNPETNQYNDMILKRVYEHDTSW